METSDKQGRPGPAPFQPDEAWWPHICAYRDWMYAGGRAKRSLAVMMTYLASLSRAHPDPWAVTHDDLVVWMSARGWAPETRKNARTAVRQFYRWAITTGRVERSPAEHLLSVHRPQAHPRPITTAALTEALERASARDRLAILLGALAGLRAMEIANVHTDDFTDGVVVVLGKGQKVRYVPVHPELQAAVDAELARRRRAGEPTVGCLFPSHGVDGPPVTAGTVTRWLSLALPGHWTAHSLRHRFATQAYAAERDLRAVQTLLGHTSPTTTARYAQVPNGALATAVAGVGLL